MLYSVRMRAAEGGAHECGGQHISGAERLLREECLEDITKKMIQRALTHSRGKADFINLTIETVKDEAITEVPLLPIMTCPVDSVDSGREVAKKLLLSAGITQKAVEQAFYELDHLQTSMRGAMLVDMITGNRLDALAERGVRVSRMDIADEKSFCVWLTSQGLENMHVREALVLAAKVAAAPQIVAELCWSDDPDYVTGYITADQRYHRITKLKEMGDWQGGRVFFVKPDADIAKLIQYLQYQPVLVTANEEMIR
ncbi:MAG: bioW [Clostridiales bacterium]|nr:bioW [Clostridiales bacterium]